MFRSAVILVLLCLLTPTGVATADDGTMILARFRARSVDGKRFEGTNGTLTTEGLNGTLSNGSPLFLPRESIQVLDRYTGTQAGKGALIGAGIGLMTGLLGWLSAEAEAGSNSSVEVDDSKILPVLAITTGIGTAVGLAVGASQSSWKNVPLETALQYDPGRGRVALKLSFSF